MDNGGYVSTVYRSNRKPTEAEKKPSLNNKKLAAKKMMEDPSKRQVILNNLSKARAKRLGSHHTEDTKRKISEGNRGKKWSDENRVARSSLMKGKPHKPLQAEMFRKKVCQPVSIEGKVYESITDAAIALDMSYSTVRSRVHGLKHPSWFLLKKEA